MVARYLIATALLASLCLAVGQRYSIIPLPSERGEQAYVFWDLKLVLADGVAPILDDNRALARREAILRAEVNVLRALQRFAQGPTALDGVIRNGQIAFQRVESGSYHLMYAVRIEDVDLGAEANEALRVLFGRSSTP